MTTVKRTSDIRISVSSGPDGVTDLHWEADEAPERGSRPPTR